MQVFVLMETQWSKLFSLTNFQDWKSFQFLHASKETWLNKAFVMKSQPFPHCRCNVKLSVILTLCSVQTWIAERNVSWKCSGIISFDTTFTQEIVHVIDCVFNICIPRPSGPRGTISASCFWGFAGSSTRRLLCVHSMTANWWWNFRLSSDTVHHSHIENMATGTPKLLIFFVFRKRPIL